MASKPKRIDREIIAEQIVEAINRSDLSRKKKRRASRVMDGRLPFRQRARREVIDFAVSELLAEELIVVTPEGAEAAISIDDIASLFERLVPIFMRLFGLFG